jgi:hypothetical protein
MFRRDPGCLPRGLADLRRGQHDLCKLVQPLLLFLDQELRVTDDVDEQHMPNSRRRLSSDSGTRFFYRTRSYTVVFF